MKPYIALVTTEGQVTNVSCGPFEVEGRKAHLALPE